MRSSGIKGLSVMAMLMAASAGIQAPFSLRRIDVTRDPPTPRLNRRTHVFSKRRSGGNNTPHQGARECARRRRQMSGERLPSVPRRLWKLTSYPGFAQVNDAYKTRRAALIEMRRIKDFDPACFVVFE